MAAPRKIPDSARELIRQTYNSGGSIASLARQHQVTELTIRRILGDLIAQRRAKIADALKQ